MPITRIARHGRKFALAHVTSSGSQNFLGAWWVERLVGSSPRQVRRRVALRLLSFSPHYFYDRDVRAEDHRNRRSRQALVDAVISPYLSGGDRVIDYGCGPGYMAYAVAQRVDHVDAVDISRGVLACAKTINGRANVTYLTPGALRQATSLADLAYSFAVVQHLRTEALVDTLGLLAEKIRPGGTLLLHYAAPAPGGWRTQADWDDDRSLSCRAKLRYGLNCFGRSADEMRELVSSSGFTGIAVKSLSGLVAEGDDIAGQQLMTARRC